MPPLPIDVTCALIVYEGRILAAQRRPESTNGGSWEFPGGKVEPGERREEGLIREIKEELAMQIQIEVALPAFTHHYPEKSLTIRLWPFCCRWMSGEPQLLAHQRIRWLRPDELLMVDWSAADRKIIDQMGYSIFEVKGE